MTWQTSRAALVTAFENLTITTPDTRLLRKVHEFPPDRLGDTPCAVLFPPSGSVQRHPGGMRRTIYRLRVRLLTTAERNRHGSEVIDELREQVIAAMDAEVKTGGAAISGINDFDEALLTDWGGSDYWSQDLFIDVQVSTDTTFTA